jgi:hypothetical protein
MISRYDGSIPFAIPRFAEAPRGTQTTVGFERRVRKIITLRGQKTQSGVAARPETVWSGLSAGLDGHRTQLRDPSRRHWVLAEVFDR